MAIKAGFLVLRYKEPFLRRPYVFPGGMAGAWTAVILTESIACYAIYTTVAGDATTGGVFVGTVAGLALAALVWSRFFKDRAAFEELAGGGGDADSEDGTAGDGRSTRAGSAAAGSELGAGWTGSPALGGKAGPSGSPGLKGAAGGTWSIASPSSSSEDMRLPGRALGGRSDDDKEEDNDDDDDEEEGRGRRGGRDDDDEEGGAGWRPLHTPGRAAVQREASFVAFSSRLGLRPHQAAGSGPWAGSSGT